MFIEESDYEVQVRQEMMSILDPSTQKSAIEMAEYMAIDQIKSYLSGRYDVETIFSKQGEHRNHFLLMIAIDITLYHLWSKRAPRKIPELRSERYQDALNWLKSVGEGTMTTDLPQLHGDDFFGNCVITSKYKPNDNKY